MDGETPPAGITPEKWAVSILTVRQLIGAMLTVAAQQQPIAQQHVRVADLEAHLNQHSRNSQ